jgi:CelD/BcsL family acetyltransferase involved in cellulose biosynthesis
MAAMMAATPGDTFADANRPKGNALNAPQPDRMKHCLEVAVIRDPQAFAALEEEWDDLYHNCPRATPYQSWAWLYSWWEAYGEGYELRLITVRSGEGLLVGIIPLMLERWWGFDKLRFIGGSIGQASADYLDVLVRRDWKAKACEAGVRALEHMAGWHVAELRQIDPTATIWDFLKGWNGPRIDLRQGSLWVIEVKPWEELLMSRSKRLRNNVRRTLRRAEEDGVRYVLAGVEDVERASRRLVALHREMRRGRHIISERLTSRFESFTLAAARRMTERGLGGISEFWRDGEVIISELMVFGPNYVGAYMVGNSREAFRLYEVSALCAYMEVNIAHRWDASYVSLG